MLTLVRAIRRSGDHDVRGWGIVGGSVGLSCCVDVLAGVVLCFELRFCLLGGDLYEVRDTENITDWYLMVTECDCTSNRK